MMSVAETTPPREARVDTLGGLANPYGLPLSEERLAAFTEALGAYGVHRLLGFLCAALTIPEPLPLAEWCQAIDYANTPSPWDETDDDATPDVTTSISDFQTELDLVAEHVRRQVASGELGRIVPVADDAKAGREWVTGFYDAMCSTLHDLTDEEAELSARLRELTAASNPHPDFEALPEIATRLIALWREVPPYDPASDAWLVEAQARRAAEASEPRVVALPPGSTPYRRTTPKVGRNDLCPCGSGKKHKKCCGRTGGS